MSDTVCGWLAALYQGEIEKVTADIESGNGNADDMEEYVGVLEDLRDELIVSR